MFDFNDAPEVRSTWVTSRQSEKIGGMRISNEIGLVDSFSLFWQMAEHERSIVSYISHVNHPNAAGHDVLATDLMKWFKCKLSNAVYLIRLFRRLVD